MRRVGLPPASVVKARDQLQKSWPDVGTPQPLPPGSPGRTTGEQVGISTPSTQVSFMVIGDHGGIENPEPQKNVAAGLAVALGSPPTRDFIYSVGDLVYFSGDPAQWMPQFYQPYTHVQTPIVGIPGNHDGSPDGTAGSGISSFMANMCTPSPVVPAADPENEFGRDTQTQPYCDWTLALDAVTIVGVWTNVPSGGHLYASQIAWLTEELRAAPIDRPLIVSLHHPPYSVDAFHGGSATMGAALDGAFSAASRWPELVLSGHIHDYQRFTRTVTGGHTPTYIVIGNSGYHNLHALAGDAKPGMDVGGGVTFEYGDDSGWGFLVLTVDPGSGIMGEYCQVSKDGGLTPSADTFGPL